MTHDGGWPTSSQGVGGRCGAGVTIATRTSRPPAKSTQAVPVPLPERCSMRNTPRTWMGARTVPKNERTSCTVAARGKPVICTRFARGCKHRRKIKARVYRSRQHSCKIC